jgi:predicted O-methyltransferase YrrM/predicted transcriptional regulator
MTANGPATVAGEHFTDPVDRLASGYRACQILLTANRLGLFEKLIEGPLSAEDLSSRLDADRRGVRILCDALVAEGLLKRAEEGYINGSLAERFLLESSPVSRVHSLHHAAKLYERWGRLFDAVKHGRPIPDERLDPELVGNEEQFAKAMADVGRVSAAETSKVLDLDGVRRLLDIGGGPAIYAIEFARRNPDLEVVVFDSEATLKVAEKNIRAAKLEERVTCRAGNALEDDLGGPFDLVFLSNVVHIYSAATNRQLVGRCASSLVPGGRLAIKDFLLDGDRLSPPGGAVFAVNMLVSTEGGDCYTVAEVNDWLSEHGLRFESLVDVATKSRLLTSRKP